MAFTTITIKMSQKTLDYAKKLKQYTGMTQQAILERALQCITEVYEDDEVAALMMLKVMTKQTRQSLARMLLDREAGHVNRRDEIVDEDRYEAGVIVDDAGNRMFPDPDAPGPGPGEKKSKKAKSR